MLWVHVRAWPDLRTEERKKRKGKSKRQKKKKKKGSVYVYAGALNVRRSDKASSIYRRVYQRAYGPMRRC